MDKPTVIGSGNYFLDTIVVRDYPAWPALRPFTERTVTEEVGGTCGNVCCMLSHLGWTALPQACLDDSPEGLKMKRDLERYGCDSRFVTNTPGGGTSLLRCTHKKDADGNHVMGVRAGAPGGSRFPRHHYLRAGDEAPEFLAALGSAPDVYFFDDPAAGHRVIAEELRRRGCLVYFEPNRISTNADLQCVGLSDIVKFSDSNVPDTSFTDRFPDKLFIQTMGSEGLRFTLRGAPWVHLPASPCPEVVDWEGAGDWATSAFLNALWKVGVLRPERMDGNTVRKCLEEAQEVAARSVAFMGSKGMINK